MPREKPDYQLPPPPSLRDEVWGSGRITALQLFRIGAWKSAKGLALMSLNSEEHIKAVSEGAVAALKSFRDVDVLSDDVDWEAWREDVRKIVGSKKNGTGLLALHGVGYPMATAVLAVLAPAAFPVIDRWTVGAIFGSTRGKWGRAVVYARFTEQLCTLQPLYYRGCETIHGVDQAVMVAAMRCAEAGCRRPCDHIPYPAIPLPT
jgi:hypothetical protein